MGYCFCKINFRKRPGSLLDRHSSCEEVGAEAGAGAGGGEFLTLQELGNSRGTPHQHSRQTLLTPRLQGDGMMEVPGLLPLW
ncbi:hypothetical protein EUGRSUZ_K01899 [Eucalyptus grandis]|uniref:Uncharacterized protein n=2 Tax=Eucalyptus grandis TaxID=71139 RepID=A0ACC3IUQ3_EUCGR|nr:hypothetical protein EUGRSUZ_K01899 [Eucalyptus grandis]